MAAPHRISPETQLPELPAPRAEFHLGEQAARELAHAFVDAFGGGTGFGDPVFDLDADGYERIRRTDCTASPFRKLGSMIGARKPTWRALDGVATERGDALNRITDAIPSLAAEFAQGVWALAEGVRFWWLAAEFNDDLDAWVPTLSHRLKQQAGGILWENADGEVFQVARPEFGAEAAPKETEHRMLPRRRVITFRPGAGTNPEGDPDLGVMLWRIAKAAELNDKNDAYYANRHGAPWVYLQATLKGMRPGDVKDRLLSSAQKLTAAARAVTALPSTDLLTLLEPSGTTAAYLGEREGRLFRRAHVLVLGNVLTSFTNESGPTGSSSVHEHQQEVVEDLVAGAITDAISAPLRSFMLRNNPRVAALPGGGEILVLERQRKVDALEAYNDGVELDADEFYREIGWRLPLGIGPTVKKNSGFSFDTAGNGFGFPGDGADPTDPTDPTTDPTDPTNDPVDAKKTAAAKKAADA